MNTIADMIERCRPTSGERAHYFADDWSRYERNALVALQQMGIETIDSVLTFGANAQPKDRYKAWLYDSLVWTIGRIRQGYPHEALRGLLQMCEYRGHLGGFWPDPMTNDAYSELRNHFEAVLRGKP